MSYFAHGGDLVNLNVGGQRFVVLELFAVLECELYSDSIVISLFICLSKLFLCVDFQHHVKH